MEGTVKRGDTGGLLGANPLFEDLTELELAQLAAVAVPRRFDKGEAIFQEGTTGDVLYLIRSGRVMIKKEHIGGRTIALAELAPGAVFGEMAAFDSEVRSASAECIEPTETIAITAGDMRRILRSNPEMALKVIVSLTRKLRAASSRIGNQYFQSTEARIAAVVLELAEAQAKDGLSGTAVTATQSEIAQLASTSRETVSRFLAACEREGLLMTRRGRLELRDPEALRRYIV